MSSVVGFPAGALYPSREAQSPGLLGDWGRLPFHLARRACGAWGARQAGFVARVRELERSVPPPESRAWQEGIAVLARNLRRFGYRVPLLARALATASAAMRANAGSAAADEALRAARGLLGGAVVELSDAGMRSAAAALAGAVAALAGRRVHVVVASDDAARAAAAQFGPALAALGLSTGCVNRGSGLLERHAAYGADVTYVSYGELVLDSLRDAQRLRAYPGALDLHVARLTGDGGPASLLLRGMQFAIVDDADRVLVDEARVAVSLTRTVSWTHDVEPLREALALAGALEQERDFSVAEDFSVKLTEHGRERIESHVARLGREGLGGRAWELVRLAACAQHALERDREYLVGDARVSLAEEAAANAALVSLWESGLRQMLELKEGCALTPRVETLARSSPGRMFRRFAEISAMGARVAEAAAALRSMYGLWLLRIVPDVPPHPATAHASVYPFARDKWEAILARARQAGQGGDAVLVRARTPQQTEGLCKFLDEAKVPWQLVQPQAPGSDALPPGKPVEPGLITVIAGGAGPRLAALLASCVPEDASLQAFLGEADETSRHTAMLCAALRSACRHATIEAHYSLEDPAIAKHASPLLRWLAERRMAPGAALPRPLARALLASASGRAESALRRALLAAARAEEQQKSLLAFSGRGA